VRVLENVPVSARGKRRCRIQVQRSEHGLE